MNEYDQSGGAVSLLALLVVLAMGLGLIGFVLSFADEIDNTQICTVAK